MLDTWWHYKHKRVKDDITYIALFVIEKKTFQEKNLSWCFGWIKRTISCVRARVPSGNQISNWNNLTDNNSRKQHSSLWIDETKFIRNVNTDVFYQFSPAFSDTNTFDVNQKLWDPGIICYWCILSTSFNICLYQETTCAT